MASTLSQGVTLNLTDYGMHFRGFQNILNEPLHAFQEMKMIFWRKFTVHLGKLIFHQKIPEISVFFVARIRVITKVLMLAEI